MKLFIWSVIPNHYQAAFFAGLRAAGADVVVCYHSVVPEERVRLGWDGAPTLPEGEFQESVLARAIARVPDWPTRVHIVPGCHSAFLLRLLHLLCKHRVAWAHWNEPSHDGWRWYASWFRKRAYASAINRFALGAFAIGEMARADLMRMGVWPESISYLPYVAPSPKDQCAPDSECTRFLGGRFCFLYAGTLERRKATDVLLRAFADVARHHRSCTLILVGASKEKDKYLRMADRFGVAGQVLFRGPVPTRELDAVFAAANVFVLPSRFDGWGVVLNEAVAAGLPIIATTRCGAAYHLLEPGQNGFRVPAGEAAPLSAAMAAYLNEPALAALHGARSLRIAEDVTPARNAERLLSSIQSWSALKGKNNAPSR